MLRAVAAAAARHPGPFSVATAELASLSDPGHQHAIDRDVDEALWEEMETGLLAHDPATQVTASVAAAILSPGFEPLAKIPLGLVLRRFEVVKLGLISAAGGYAVLMTGAVAAFLMLRAFGAADTAALLASPAAEALAHPSATDLLISLCGAFAGLVITSAFRNSVIAGALVAMRLIDAAATFGVALVAGAPGLVLQALERLGLDAALIGLAGVLVIGIKQRFTHRRTPLH